MTGKKYTGDKLPGELLIEEQTQQYAHFSNQRKNFNLISDFLSAMYINLSSPSPSPKSDAFLKTMEEMRKSECQDSELELGHRLSSLEESHPLTKVLRCLSQNIIFVGVYYIQQVFLFV